MKQFKISFIPFLTIFLSVFLSGCNAHKESKIVLGIHSWPGGGTAYVALEKGYFKEEGVNIDIKRIENFDTKRASLIGGSIDIDVANTLDQLLIYRQNGFNAQVIGITDESTGGDGIVVKSEIKDVHDLIGKTIVYAEASPSDFFLRYVLADSGVRADQIILKPVADPQIAGNSIISKQVDAAVTFEPWLTQAQQTDGLRLLISTEKYPTLIPGLLIANGKNITADPELYKHFLKAWLKAVDYIYAHPDESHAIIAKGMGMKLDDVNDILKKVTIQDLANNKKLILDSNNFPALVTKISTFWKQNKFITKDIDASAAVNSDILKGQ